LLRKSAIALNKQLSHPPHLGFVQNLIQMQHNKNSWGKPKRKEKLEGACPRLLTQITNER
jgi:hypothetical protein